MSPQIESVSIATVGVDQQLSLPSSHQTESDNHLESGSTCKAQTVSTKRSEEKPPINKIRRSKRKPTGRWIPPDEPRSPREADTEREHVDRANRGRKI